MSSKVKVTFLGTGSHIPSSSRNTPSTLISYQGENILVDCGEGTQRQFRIAGLNPGRITKILISHWHGDHTFGLPGLLSTISNSEYSGVLEIYGPKGTNIQMKKFFETFGFVRTFEIKVFEISKPGIFFENNDFYLEAREMTHDIPSNAYNFVIKGQRRIDKKKLREFKLKQGAHLRNLKEGKDIEHEGKKFFAKDLTFHKSGKKISVVMDTSYNKRIAEFVKDADLFICESVFSHDLINRAKERYHMTARQVAETARKARARKLILTHISRRYEKNFNVILKEAKRVFKNVSIAKDFDVFYV